MFDLYVVANELNDDKVIRAKFLTMMGDEVSQIFKSNYVKEDDLAAIKEKMEAVLVT